MKRRTQYKFKKPPKAIKKKQGGSKRPLLANRKSSSRSYFIKKKTLRAKLLTIGFGIAALLAIVSYILFFASIFQIKHIEVMFINEKTLLSESEVRNMVYTILNKKYLYFFQQNNLFLFKKNNLDEIVRQDSRIESITLDKKWPPARLIITISESQRVAQLVIYGDGEEYYLNNYGQIIISSNFKSGGDDTDRNITATEERRDNDDGDFATTERRRNNLPFTTQGKEEKKGDEKKDDKEKKREKQKEEEKVIETEKDEKNAPSFKIIVMVDNNEKQVSSLEGSEALVLLTPLPIFYDKTSQNVKDPEVVSLFERILNFITNSYFTDHNIYIPLISITEEGGIYEVEMETTEGWRIFINSEMDFKKQLSNLELILKEKIPQRELLQYIDLRFGKKIFYKNLPR